MKIHAIIYGGKSSVESSSSIYLWGTKKWPLSDSKWISSSSTSITANSPSYSTSYAYSPSKG
jgi:hypothetical protein